MKTTSLLLALTLLGTAGHALADRLDDIKKAGVLRVAAFDSNPPFGFLDAQTHQISGLDVESAHRFSGFEKRAGVSR